MIELVDLHNVTIDELLDELKKRRYVYYEVGSLFEDPVINPDIGLVHIYDIREEWERYASHDDDAPEICKSCIHLKGNICLKGESISSMVFTNKNDCNKCERR